jgi:hypothetical protein
MQWFASLPENEARDSVVKQGYSFWLKNKRDEAVSWIETAEPTRAWEPAWASYSTSLARTDPRTAVAKAGEISNLALRGESLVAIGKIWYSLAPGPATAWLEQSELTDEQQERVTHPPKSKKKARRGGSKPGGSKPGERSGRRRG